MSAPRDEEPMGPVEFLLVVALGITVAGLVMLWCEPEPYVVDDLFAPHVVAR